MITTEMIVEKANEVRLLLDGAMAQIQRLINDNDLVFAVWQDRTAPQGVGTDIIKGRKLLAEISLSGQPRTLKWTAIPCVEYEQAVALRQYIGDQLH
jgi:hypothetical protein